MSNISEVAKQNTILKTKIGSQLYGTALPTSDVDYAGIFIAPKEFYLGLNSVEEVDLSIVSKNEDGKNNQDAVDCKLFELRKYFKLAMDCNPNIAELLYFTKDSLEEISEEGKILVENRDIFLSSSKIIPRFYGYATSQAKKMFLKPSNYKALANFKEAYDQGLFASKNLMIEYKHISQTLITFSEDFASIGDLNFNFQRQMKDVYASVKTRLEKATHRQDGFLKHGYDTKFGMHTVRLLMEGIELLITGGLKYPLKERYILLDIRNGKYNNEEIIQLIDYYKNQYALAEQKSVLPEKPDFNKINSLLISMVEEFWRK